MLGTYGERDSAARGELRGYNCFSWRTGFDEVVENMVGHRFVEGALVAVRRKIKLERLTFHAKAVRYVIDVDPGKIGLTCDWADGSEIIRCKMNPVIPAGRRIWKSFKPRLGGRRG